MRLFISGLEATNSRGVYNTDIRGTAYLMTLGRLFVQSLVRNGQLDTGRTNVCSRSYRAESIVTTGTVHV